jgi:NADH dehydrogenase
MNLIGALEDLAHGALRFYPGIRPSELRFILAPHGSRLLAEVDQRLGEYVVQKFKSRDIDVRLGVGVTAVTARSATLSTGEIIPTRTVVWTTGVEVNPVLQRVDLPKDRHGALVVNNRLQVEGHPHIFALGDCAAVPVPDGDGTYSLTAQNATREGPVAAKNVAAMVRKVGSLRAFDYKPMGSLASLGCRQAVAQIEQLHLSGLLAWFAWRGVYLFKLPTLADRMLVLLDWMTDLVAPVDIVQVPLGRKRFVGAMVPDESRTAAPPQPTAKEQQPASGQAVPF